MSLLDQFEEFRRAIAIDEPMLESDPNGIADQGTEPPLDLFTLVAEWSALRHEIKQQNMLQQRTALSLADALQAIEELRARIESERIEAGERREQDLGQIRDRLEQQSQARFRQMALGAIPALDSLDFAIRHWEESSSDYSRQPVPWLGRRHYQSLGVIIASSGEGLRGIRDRFLQWLAESGVEPIGTTGRAFDSATMMAVGTHQAAAGEPTGHVHSESLRGYMLDRRLLRAAEVVVTVQQTTGSNNR